MLFTIIYIILISILLYQRYSIFYVKDMTYLNSFKIPFVKTTVISCLFIFFYIYHENIALCCDLNENISDEEKKRLLFINTNELIIKKDNLFSIFINEPIDSRVTRIEINKLVHILQESKRTLLFNETQKIDINIDFKTEVNRINEQIKTVLSYKSTYKPLFDISEIENLKKDFLENKHLLDKKPFDISSIQQNLGDFDWTGIFSSSDSDGSIQQNLEDFDWTGVFSSSDSDGEETKEN